MELAGGASKRSRSRSRSRSLSRSLSGSNAFRGSKAKHTSITIRGRDGRKRIIPVAVIREGANKGLRNCGTRRMVWNGTAVKTTGGLRRGDLKQNKSGAIVSKAASEASKKTYQRNSNSREALRANRFVKGARSRRSRSRSRK
jgi:hypothetical protein